VSARGASRWEENVQYYNYTSDTLRREPWSDEYVVAEAFIYDMQKEEVTTAITVVASGPEIDRMPRDEAIRRGEMVCDAAVAKYRAQLPTQSHVVDDGALARIYLFTVDMEMPAAFPRGRTSPAILRYDLTGRLDTNAGRSAVKKTGARKLLLIAVFLVVLGLTLPVAILALM
jgi:hypothetical protein